MQLIGFLMLLGCAEWALIFRTWVSFRYLLLYAGIGFLRLYYLFTYFPHWDAHYFIFPACILAVVQHLRSLWRASTSHNQQTYNTPETGVPWLAIIAQNRKRAQFLEYVIMMAFVWYMANYGRIVYGPKFLTLSPAWRAWFINPSNASTFPSFLQSPPSSPMGCGTWPSRACHSSGPVKRPPAEPLPSRARGIPPIATAAERQGAVGRYRGFLFVNRRRHQTFTIAA